MTTNTSFIRIAVFAILLSATNCSPGNCPSGQTYTCYVNSTSCFCAIPCSASGGCPSGTQCLRFTEGEDICAPPEGTTGSATDPLEGRSWSSSTRITCNANAVYSSSTYTISFGAGNRFSGSWTITYASNSPTYPGCTESTTISGGTWSDSVASATSGSFTVSGTSTSTNRNCGPGNPNTQSNLSNLYTGAINGGASSFSISGGTMTVTGNSGIPVDCGTWVFGG